MVWACDEEGREEEMVKRAVGVNLGIGKAKEDKRQVDEKG